MTFRVTTARLRLDEVTSADASDILALLNEPRFIEHIGDRGVRTLEQALTYIQQGPQASYQQHGFGLWAVRQLDGQFVGMCGLLQRDYLDFPDLGYALLQRYEGQGYITEAARACLAWGQQQGITEFCAIVSPGNQASMRVLDKLGFRRLGQKQNPQGQWLDYFELACRC